MPYQVRLLTAEDRTASWELGSTTFGYRDSPMPDGWGDGQPGRDTWGVFDETGRLIAKAVDREQGHWFGGRIVPAAGVASVSVAPEVRGTGLARLVLTRLLAGARDRGAVISTLFDTTPFPYRRLGWEEVGALTYTAVPVHRLAAVRGPRDVTLRPATEQDVPAMAGLYRSAARTSAGLMERSGPMFAESPAELLAGYHGVTVAIGPTGAVDGYAAWDRGTGYDHTGKVTVFDLYAATPDATAALVAMFGGWASVAPTIVLRLPETDPVWLTISSAGATVQSRQPWMLRVVDLPGAVAARGWPAYLHGAVDLDVVDEVCPWHAGPYRLVLSGGEGRAEPGGTGAVRIAERGLGLLYAGAADPAMLRRLGLLTGGDPADDEFLRSAFAGPRPALLNYF